MPPEPAAGQPRSEAYAWYLLGVLILVYVFNFIDRQLLTILAPELKRDLHISNSDFGFLYGTAFGVFYALFGIPLGKLADRWVRVRLLAVGLALWSVMTALSGASRNFAQLATARVGVGVGEATLSPCTYSLVSDYFPPHRRATALGVYSSGLYFGTGISLFLGASIVDVWNRAFPAGTAPLGLAGWQAAFLLVGIPGVGLAAWVSTLREPPRGTFDSASALRSGDPLPAPAIDTGDAFRAFLADVGEILPPFTLWAAARRGGGALVANLATALVVGLAATLLVRVSGDRAQWIAVGLGVYAVLSWIAALRAREPATYVALLRAPAFIGVTIGYSLLSLLGYANFAFSPLYAIQELHADPKTAAFMLGSLGALGGTIGVVGGGIIADRLAKSGDHARRIALTAVATAATMIGHAVMFRAPSLAIFYPAAFVTLIFMSATLGGAAGALVNIVPPHLRGTATAVFLLGTNLIGLALGPYSAGKLSDSLGDLGLGLSLLTALLPPTLLALWVAWRALRR